MSSFTLFLLILGFILWIVTLVSHLRRTDLTDTDRIVWTIVLCTLNMLGMVLYWILAPAGTSRVRTEQELKDYFNSRAG